MGLRIAWAARAVVLVVLVAATVAVAPLILHLLWKAQLVEFEEVRWVIARLPAWRSLTAP